MEFGEKIKAIRKAKKLNQSEFAAPIGITASYVSDIEKSKKFNLDDIKLEKLLKVYNVSLVWWETQTGEMFISEDATVENQAANFGPSLEDQLAWEEWKNFSRDQKLQAVILLRTLKAGH